MESIAPRFCPRCGTAIPNPPEGDRPTCPSCDYVWYGDPKLATGVLVSRPRQIDDAEAARAAGPKGHQGPEGPPKGHPNGLELLLVRRNHAPAIGRWAFPSGFVDAGEVVEDAAVREVFEETAVNVRLDGLVGVYSEADNAVVFIAYAGTLVAGEATAGDEAFEVGWFPPDALPDLAFPHDDEIVADWRRLHAARPERA